MPIWREHKLIRHYQKRTNEDAGCFEDLLKLSGQMTLDQYERRSHDAVDYPSLKYEGKSYDDGLGEFRNAAMYFVDKELVVAITDAWEREFDTCYHKHYRDLDHHKVMALSPAARNILYKRRLEAKVQGDLFRDLRWHLG